MMNKTSITMGSASWKTELPPSVPEADVVHSQLGGEVKTTLFRVLVRLLRLDYGKESVCNVGGLGSIPGLGRYPGEWNGTPLQYSYLENPMDKPGGLQFMGSQRVGHD